MSRVLSFVSLTLIFLLTACGQAQSGVSKKEMKASEIIKLINKGKDVHLNDRIIVDDLDFSSVKDLSVASVGKMESHVGVNLFFSNCVFLGNVTAIGEYRKLLVYTSFSKNVTFFDCDFRGNLTMDYADVYGTVEFSRSAFRGETSFNNIYVRGNRLGFLEVEAERNFSMVDADIRGNANFMNAKFDSTANFLGMRVNKLQCSNVVFSGNVDFSNSFFNGDVLFNYVEYGANAQFSFSKYYGNTDFMHSVYTGSVSYERSSFYGGVRWNKSTYASTVETKDATFLSLPVTTGVSLNGKVDIDVANFIKTNINK